MARSNLKVLGVVLPVALVASAQKQPGGAHRRSELELVLGGSELTLRARLEK